jgi:hypothetical protein
MSTTIGKIADALAAVQSEIESITAEKTGQLGHRTYKYADLNAHLEQVRSILPKHGIAIVQRPLPSDGETVKLETLLLHKSDEWIGSEISIKSANTTAQAIGSAITYARRYSLAAMLGLSVDDDDDGKAASVSAGPAKTTIDTTEKINYVTKKRIIHVCENLDWSPEKLSEVLNSQGVAKLDDMQQGDAQELAGILEKKFLDQQAKEAFS